MGTVVIKMLLQSTKFTVLARVFGRVTREKGFEATDIRPSPFDCAIVRLWGYRERRVLTPQSHVISYIVISTIRVTQFSSDYGWGDIEGVLTANAWLVGRKLGLPVWNSGYIKNFS